MFACRLTCCCQSTCPVHLLQRRSEGTVLERIPQPADCSFPLAEPLLVVEEGNPVVDRPRFEAVKIGTRFAAGEETLGSARTNLEHKVINTF